MIELIYQLRFETPVHVGTGYGFASFLDSVVMRDRQGQVYLPGSSIKGKARAAARRLVHGLQVPTELCPAGTPCGRQKSEPCAVCRLFGSPQFPGQLFFDNVHLPDDYRRLLTELKEQDRLLARQATTQRRTHVMLSRQRRASRPDHLYTNELVQADLPLGGHISGQVVGGQGQAVPASENDLALLWGALRLVTHLGRARSRGLGRCTIHVVQMQINGSTCQETDCGQMLQALGGGVPS